MSHNIKIHPCFGDDCETYARLHLPVAPACNIQCNYCLRKYDCVNESRPGVTTRLLSSEEAVLLCERAAKKMKNLTVVGIAGPGDTLANFDEVYTTLQKIREKNIPVEFCVSTNGLNLFKSLPQLLELEVKYLTITVNAVDVEIGSKIYEYVIWQDQMLVGEAAFRRLSANQLQGIRAAVDKGIICKINTIVIPGINDQHIPEIAETVGGLGCYMQNLIPMINVSGTKFERLPVYQKADLLALRKKCSLYIKQMEHCQRCRADACGTLMHSYEYFIQE